jgi:hypothetical protein
MYTKNLCTKIDSQLLAAHVADNPEFAEACLSGITTQVMSIVEAEMEKNNLFTEGSKKLHDDILSKFRGKETFPPFLGSSILQFVWNSRLAGNGLAVN